MQTHLEKLSVDKTGDSSGDWLLEPWKKKMKDLVDHFSQ